MTRSHHILPPLVASLLLLAWPALGAPPRGVNAKAKARPSYFMVVKAPMLAKGVDSSHGQFVDSMVRQQLGRSAALVLHPGKGKLPRQARLKRQLRRRKLSGMLTVPSVSGLQPTMVAGRMVVRCKVHLVLATLQRQQMIFSSWGEAQITGGSSLTAAALQELQQDVLRAAASVAAKDLAEYLERQASIRSGAHRASR